jgi:nucleotide-binding universal stress UspA family protein
MEHPTVLVFVEFPDPTVPTNGFLNHLKYPDAKLVGFYQLDDNESIEEAQTEYEDEFTAELAEVAERFEERGIRTEYSLVFSDDRVGARQRLAESDDIDGILLPGAANTLCNVLIASRDLRNAEKKVPLLNIVDRDDLISIDLVHVADPENPEGHERGEQILSETASMLTDEGFPRVKIGREVRTGTDVAFELSQAARGYDLVVLGETERDIGDEIFGPVGKYILNEQGVPVLIVR